MRGLPLVAASGGHSSSQCTGLSLSRPLLLRSTGSRRAGSVVVAHGPSCSAAYVIFPDKGSNPCPLHWQADSQPLRHQGSPTIHSLLRVTWEHFASCFWGRHFASCFGHLIIEKKNRVTLPVRQVTPSIYVLSIHRFIGTAKWVQISCEYQDRK